ncbi:MepB family protein [uncultured Aquimarina sp.]|uniref:MepB family protein n=1 Tax=uncultured Aquimarina sp. TaxID=575652 RepID=UPI002634DD3B|nr:MepB family protein [uncultured Aquimarina sp.]
MNDLHKELVDIKKLVFDPCALTIKKFSLETESKEYKACNFHLNDLKIVCRNAKITPKKVGQFVTFWKRKKNGPIEPFEETDLIDYFMVNVKYDDHFGQFIFPKSKLIEKGIISTNKKEGKRAFRVYPPWDTVINKQAERTQKWQLNYFLRIDNSVNIELAQKLYSKR